MTSIEKLAQFEVYINLNIIECGLSFFAHCQTFQNNIYFENI